MRICINKQAFAIADRFVPVFSVYSVDRYKVVFYPQTVIKTVQGKTCKGICCTALVDGIWRSAVLWQNDAVVYIVSGKAFMLCREAGTYEKVSAKLARVSNKAEERSASMRRLNDAVEVAKQAPHLRQEHSENWLRMKY